MMMTASKTIALLLLLFIVTLDTVTSSSTGKVLSRRKLSSNQRRMKKKGPKGRNCSVDQKDDKVKFKCTSKRAGPESAALATDAGVQALGADMEMDDPEASQSRAGILEDFENSEDIIMDQIKYEMKFSKDGGLAVKVQYKEKIETGEDEETESKTKFEISFDKIIEYEKSDNEDSATGEAYDWEYDTIIQEFSLSSIDSFSPVEDDGVIARFSASTPDTGMGIATFTFTISRGGDGDSMASANKVKIDFELTDFLWAQNNTYVALLSTIESQRKVDVKSGDDDSSDDASGDDEHHHGPGSGKHSHFSHTTEEVSIHFDDIIDTTESGVFGEYTWASTADATVGVQNTTGGNETAGLVPVDEVEPSFTFNNASSSSTEVVSIEVIATSPTESTDPDIEYIAFSFVGEGAQSASDIYWDPEAGVGYNADSGSSVGDAAAARAVFSAVCGLAMTVLVLAF